MADQLDISALTNDIYVSADVVGRELNGFIPSVTMNASSAQASKGDTIKAAFTRAASAADIVERMDMQEADNSVTVDSKSLTLSKARRVQIPLGGEDTRQLQNTGQYASVYGDLITQAMRTLANEIEVEIATALKQGAAFASGTAGTTPFAVGSATESGVEELLEARRILVDDGMPTDDVSAVLNTTAGANIRSNLKLLDQGFSNTGALREQGILIPIAGIDLRESGNITTHTKGTLGSSPLTDVTDAVGATSIAVNGGTGTILVGDAVQFGGSGNVHIVGTGTSDASGGTITLNAGLKSEVANDTAVAIAANYLPSFVFHRAACELAMRAPAMPLGGDMASESITVQDPHSGLVFQVSTYRGYHKSLIEVAAVFGVKVWKGDFVHTILG